MQNNIIIKCYDCNETITDSNSLICNMCCDEINNYIGYPYCTDCIDEKSFNSSARNFTELFKEDFELVILIFCDKCFEHILLIENEDKKYNVIRHIIESFRYCDEEIIGQCDKEKNINLDNEEDSNEDNFNKIITIDI